MVFATRPTPAHESNQDHSAQSAREVSRAGEADWRPEELAALVEHGYSMT